MAPWRRRRPSCSDHHLFLFFFFFSLSLSLSLSLSPSSPWWLPISPLLPATPLQWYQCWRHHRRPIVSSTTGNYFLSPAISSMSLFLSLHLSLSLSIYLSIYLSLFSLHPDTHSFHFHFGGNPFFLPFDFYSALFGDLGFVFVWALDCVYEL